MVRFSNNKTTILLILYLAQVLFSLSLLIFGFYARIILIFAFILLVVFTVVLFREVLRSTIHEVRSERFRQRSYRSRQVINVLRSQRHDFVNHLQVIMGYTQLKKYEDLKHYVDEVAKELTVTGRVTNLSIPELAVLLLHKNYVAEEKGIPLEVEVTTSLEELHISVQYVIRILGNLIDNAIYAVEHAQGEQKEIQINIFELNDKYVFEVWNSVPVILPEIQKKIFEKGFSTKNTEGSGYGLTIVKDLAEKNLGRVTLHSEVGEGTTFRVELPQGIETKHL